MTAPTHHHEHHSQSQVTLDVRGMHCASCVSHVEKGLRSVPGVSDARVNLATNEAAVTFDAAKAGVDELISAVKSTGYDASLPPDPHADHHHHDGAGEHDHDHGDDAAWRRRVIVGAIFTAPLVVIAMVMAWHSPVMVWVQFALALPVQIVLGWPFYVGTWNSVKRLRPDMDTLVALGSTAAFAYSLYLLLAWQFGGAAHAHDAGMPPHVYFETAAVILTLIGVGKLLEARARSSAASAIRELMNLQPPVATVLRDGQEHEVRVSEIQVGDTILVRPGQRIAVDGVVTSGASAVDQSMLTGESMPIDVAPGSQVTGGTLNQTGAFQFRATRIGKHTALAQIVELVKQAQTSKAKVQRVADAVAGVFVQIVMVIALATLLIWGLAFSNWNTGLFASIAVLIVACPCAMGLATPAAIMVGTGLGARMGILIKDAAALERAGKLTHIILDKTGTLTRGEPAVVDVWEQEHHPGRVVPVERHVDSQTAAESEVAAAPPLRDGAPENGALDLLRFAAAVEQNSEHPLGKAIVRAAKERNLALAPVADFKSITAGGVRGVVGGRTVIVGKLATLREHGVEIAAELEARLAEEAAKGRTVVAVAVDGHSSGLIMLADELKANAKEAVAELHRLGLKTILMTGDQRAAGIAVAKELDIDDVFAEVLPQDKQAKVSELQRSGGIVAMVGDGINDAPALAAADIGIAIGGGQVRSAQRGVRNETEVPTAAFGAPSSALGNEDADKAKPLHKSHGISLAVLNPTPQTPRPNPPAPAGGGSDIAMQAGHVVLVGGDLAALPRAIRLSRATMRRIYAGLFWAFIYNILLIPLAALGYLHPMLAAAAMAFSSISVVLNALWLRWRWRSGP